MDGDTVAVIGAGPAGLAVSACLRRAAVAHVVLEREGTVGSTWRRHYERLHLHTTKTLSGLPHTPWAKSAPRFPSRAEVVDYLERYAEEHRVAPRFAADVQAIVPREGGFTLRLEGGEELAARAVVVATGYNGVPFVPEVPGVELAALPMVHTSDYRSGATYAGKRVLVVGCGNSGAEIALDLAEHGAKPMMVVRGPVHVVPREMFGRPSQETGVMLARLPTKLRDALSVTLLRFVVGDLSRWGIVRPKQGPTELIETQGRIPLLDLGTIDAVKAGRIEVVPGVARFEPGRAVLSDGTTRELDAIVWATGFRTGLRRLFPDGLELDARGRPLRFGEATRPGLFFVGFRNPPTGALREIAFEAERVARALGSGTIAG